MSDFGKLPPLNALRGFEAVARHLSFGRAADELNVTPAAVSQQIKVLEDYLGIKLFLRQGRRIQLSEAGRQLLPGIEKGFDNIADAVRPFLGPASGSHITCSTVGAFAVRWLVPRLSSWIAEQPDTDIRISTTGEIVDFERNGIDVAIRLGDGNWEGLRSDLLLQEQVVPLCSPGQVSGDPGLKEPGDLVHHQLIHFIPPLGGLNTKWEDWFKIAGVEGIDTSRGIFFNDGAAAINAAMRGQGVVLAPRSMAIDDLEAGALVSPFEIELPTDLAWYIVMPESNLSRPEVVAFRDWLLAEAGTNP